MARTRSQGRASVPSTAVAWSGGRHADGGPAQVRTDATVVTQAPMTYDRWIQKQEPDASQLDPQRGLAMDFRGGR